MTWRSRNAKPTSSGDALVTTVVKCSDREARALREASRMSVRAFSAHLGVAVASGTNWEQRAGRIRLRHATQEILDRDFKHASDDVRDRFEATLGGVSATSTSDDARRLEHVLACPSGADI